MSVDDIRQIFADRFRACEIGAEQGAGHVLISILRCDWREPYVLAIQDGAADETVLDHVRIAEVDLAKGGPGPKWGP